MVSDENGVVILGSVADWKFTTLRALDETTRSAFDQTQQYNRRALKPLGMKEISELEHGARLVSIAKEAPEMASVYPVTGSLPCPVAPAAGHPVDTDRAFPSEQVDDIAQTRSAMVAVLAHALLFMLGMNINERRRRLKDRLAAREALAAGA
jgi:C4-dicarboxylate-specific signal transduction histidine kinase